MKRLWLLGAGLLLAGAAQAQVVPATGATWAAFIPPPYRLLPGGDSLATGDLNGDGRPDVALALADTARHDWPRLLLVLLRTPAGGYRLAARSRRVLPGPDDSYLGDAFEGVAVERGCLVLRYDIGGRRGRSTTARFRYQPGGFRLIGETDAFGTHHPSCDELDYPPEYDYRDTNYLTGRYEVIRTSANCRLLVHKRGRQPLKPLVRLPDYKPAP